MTQNLVHQFEEVSITHVPRSDNDQADILSKLASTKKTGQHRTLIQEVEHSELGMRECTRN